MDAKISSQKYDEKLDVCKSSKYPPPETCSDKVENSNFIHSKEAQQTPH